MVQSMTEKLKGAWTSVGVASEGMAGRTALPSTPPASKREKSRRCIEGLDILFVSQCFDRIETRRTNRGDHTTHQSHRAENHGSDHQCDRIDQQADVTAFRM